MPETDEITIDTFRIKQLIRDPEWWVAVFITVSMLVPDVGVWWAANQAAVYPILAVLAGRFIVRAKAADALGRFSANLPSIPQVPDYLPETNHE